MDVIDIPVKTKTSNDKPDNSKRKNNQSKNNEEENAEQKPEVAKSKDTLLDVESEKDSNKTKIFDKEKYVEAPLPKTNPWKAPSVLTSGEWSRERWGVGTVGVLLSIICYCICCWKYC